MNLAKYFWNRKEKRYEEMSGNLMLTLRAIAQKPLGKTAIFRSRRRVRPITCRFHNQTLPWVAVKKNGLVWICIRWDSN